MGIYLHLIDFRSPRGFEIVVPEGHRNAYQRMRISPNDSMQTVVSNILRQYNRPSDRHPLDVIRIEAHGDYQGGSAIVNKIKFGQAMDALTVDAFREIRPLWHVVYQPDDHGVRYQSVIPRIEMHCCELVPGCNEALQALAVAAQAPVFASSLAQDVDARPGSDPFALERPGYIYRFNPYP
jgi:hypothetical protein